MTVLPQEPRFVVDNDVLAAGGRVVVVGDEHSHATVPSQCTIGALTLPTISIVIPSYNQAAFLAETLESVVRQDYGRREIIVMDGGSTDGSVDIIRRYEAHLDEWVSEPDEGQSDALIRGFSRSRGDIQCWLNSDDLMAPGALATVARLFAERRDMRALYGDAVWIDREGRRLRVQREMPFNRFIWLYTYNYIPCCSMFWRRSLYEEVGGIDVSFHLAMDSDLWAKFAERTRLHHVRRIFSMMRFYPEQKTQAATLEERAREDARVISRFVADESPLVRKSKRVVARAARVAWRAATGCYTLDYRPNLARLAERSRSAR